MTAQLSSKLPHSPLWAKLSGSRAKPSSGNTNHVAPLKKLSDVLARPRYVHEHLFRKFSKPIISSSPSSASKNISSSLPSVLTYLALISPSSPPRAQPVGSPTSDPSLFLVLSMTQDRHCRPSSHLPPHRSLLRHSISIAPCTFSSSVPFVSLGMNSRSCLELSLPAIG